MEVCYAIVKVQLSIRTLFGKSLYISRLFMYNNVGKVVTFCLRKKTPAALLSGGIGLED